jgi:glycosyltransferase involved in cell wall biosynthesis
MKKLSAVIIAKDSADYIAKSLESVSFCDQIIVIDNDSKDDTAKVAKDKKAEVFNFSGDDFSELRNFGIKKAEGDFILYIDSDEVVDDVLRSEILKVLEQDNSKSSYYVVRKNFYFGDSPWPGNERIERLFLKDHLKGWQGKIHESPIVDGDKGLLKGYLLHFTHRDLTSMLNKTIEWSKIEADLRLKANHPLMSWWRFPRVMITAFFDSYIKKKGYKAGTVGIIESIFQSYSAFITYARLWEMQQKNK